MEGGGLRDICIHTFMNFLATELALRFYFTIVASHVELRHSFKYFYITQYFTHAGMTF